MTADLPVQDLIADVIEDAYDAWRVHPAEVAAAVVAAIQGATVEQQAELLGDDVVGGYQTGSGIDMADLSVLGADGEYHRGPYRRVIGPWREDPA